MTADIAGVENLIVGKQLGNQKYLQINFVRRLVVREADGCGQHYTFDDMSGSYT